MSLNPDAIAATNSNIAEAVNEVLLGSNGANGDAIAATLRAAGFDELTDDSFSKLEDVLRTLVSLISDADELRRATIREAVIKKFETLNIRAPARLVDAAVGRGKTQGDSQQGQALILSDPVPWPEPVNGALLLTDIARTVRRFVVMQEWQAVAVALWCVHTHALDASSVSPFLTASSPEMRSGKSTLTSIVSRLVPRPVSTTNISPASVFRTIEKYSPTLLIDEADSFLKLSEELRGILNSAHFRSTAYVIRTAGDEHEPRVFSTWCAKTVALIGRLPATLEDRSILIQMRRKKKTEKVEKFSPLNPHPEIEEFRRKAASWTTDNMASLRRAAPEIPDQLDDRAQDNWAPLLAVADVAGGNWPQWAKIAARAFVDRDREESIKTELLKDIKAVIDGREKISSEDLVDALGEMKHRPWAEWKVGKPITQRQVAAILRTFGVKPKKIRFDEKSLQGYDADSFEDPFGRYLVEGDHIEGQLIPPDPEQVEQLNEINVLKVIFDPEQKGNVPDPKRPLSNGKQKDVPDVPDWSAKNGVCEDGDGFNWQTGEQEDNSHGAADGFEDVSR